MPIEIELKFRVADFATIRRRIEGAGGTRGDDTLETNLFLDSVDLRLRSADCGLRVRRNHLARLQKESIVITYKGARIPGPVKSREEIELRVDSLDAAVAMFDRLGYVQTLSFEKRRQTWRLGPCTVELDELPRLGTFLEIEGPSEAAVFGARASLGLQDTAIEPASYAELVGHYLEAAGANVRSLTFA